MRESADQGRAGAGVFPLRSKKKKKKLETKKFGAQERGVDWGRKNLGDGQIGNGRRKLKGEGFRGKTIRNASKGKRGNQKGGGGGRGSGLGGWLERRFFKLGKRSRGAAGWGRGFKSTQGGGDRKSPLPTARFPKEKVFFAAQKVKVKKKGGWEKKTAGRKLVECCKITHGRGLSVGLLFIKKKKT